MMLNKKRLTKVDEIKMILNKKRLTKEEEIVLMFEMRRLQNLKVLEGFLSPEFQLKRKIINEEKFKELKEETYKLQDMENFGIYLERILFNTKNRYHEIQSEIEKKGFDFFKEKGNEELNHYFMGMLLKVRDLPYKKEKFILDWSKINFEKTEEYLFWLLVLETTGVSRTFKDSKNLNKKHIFEDLAVVSGFLKKFLLKIGTFEENDLVWYKEFREKMYGLNQKLYLKCYYQKRKEKVS